MVTVDPPRASPRPAAAAGQPCLRQRRVNPARSAWRQRERVSLCETLDRVLNKGAVVAGDIVISIAGIDLVYVGLNLVVASADTMHRWALETEARCLPDVTTVGVTARPQPGRQT